MTEKGRPGNSCLHRGDARLVFLFIRFGSPEGGEQRTSSQGRELLSEFGICERLLTIPGHSRHMRTFREYIWERCALICQMSSSKLPTHTTTTKNTLSETWFITLMPQTFNSSLMPKGKTQTPSSLFSPLLDISLMIYLVTIVAAPPQSPPPYAAASADHFLLPKGFLATLSQADPLPRLPSLRIHFLKFPSPLRFSPTPQGPLDSFLPLVKILSLLLSSWLYFWGSY